MPGPLTLETLRAHAVARSFHEHASIGEAIAAHGFVQADPIRAPARAQDLILRQRVKTYRAGDLEAAYASLDLDEALLHVHGFLPRDDARLLYPHRRGPQWQDFVRRHAALRQPILKALRERGATHPREIERLVGSTSAVNGWGGQSSATTLMLEALHRTGVLRIARREAGQRVYELAPPRGPALAPALRAEGIARLVATLYAPMPERSLRQTLGRFRASPSAHPVAGLRRLVDRGELRREVVAGEAWIWPATEALEAREDDRVRLLAPFDPVVWDRRRFTIFWGWEYRFEAYTPVAKRKLGYYALPMLWRGEVLGWANVAVRGAVLDAELGFVSGKPRARAFRAELDVEMDRLRAFLSSPRATGGETPQRRRGAEAQEGEED